MSNSLSRSLEYAPRRVGKVLIIESDSAIAALLSDALADDGHAVAFAALREAPAQTRSFRPDAVVLDWPERADEGRAACIALRNSGALAVLVTAVRSSADDLRVMFEAGADDVLRKPFDLDELLLRVQALARRATTLDRSDDVPLVVGAITIDRGQVLVNGSTVRFTQRELAALTHLARRADRKVTRGELMSVVWGKEAPSSNVLVAHVNNLRAKLGGATRQLRTLRGVGYLLSTKIEP